MKKTPKKIAIFLFALAAVVLIGVVIMLLLSGRGPEPSGSPSPGASPSSAVTETPSAEPVDEGSITQTTTAEGTIFTVTVPGDFVTYSVTVGKDTFELTGKSDDILLTDPNSDDFINITFSKETSASSLAPKLMDRYIKYNEFEQSGLNDIPGTNIAGETVAAGDGSTLVKAWLVDTGGGVLAVVLRQDITDTANQTAQLYDVLKTLKIDESA
jgi:hypothetical protein